MKKLILSSAIALALCVSSAASYAQVSAIATATATIVAPIAISKTADMNFGNVAVSNAAGTVVLTPAGSRTRTGGVTLPTTAGTDTAASFNVSGAGNYSFSVTLPSTDIILTRNTGTETMTVNNFISVPSSTGALTSGTATIDVGATLHVNASQVPGVYVSGTPFTVTVNYN